MALIVAGRNRGDNKDIKIQRCKDTRCEKQGYEVQISSNIQIPNSLTGAHAFLGAISKRGFGIWNLPGF
jgi:hypothetical protein